MFTVVFPAAAVAVRNTGPAPNHDALLGAYLLRDTHVSCCFCVADTGDMSHAESCALAALCSPRMVIV